MSLVWNGDLSTGDLSQWGGVEFGGTQDGTPALTDRIKVATTVDGIKPPGSATHLARISVQPGDQYGSSTGWRTLLRQSEPIRYYSDGDDTTVVWAVLLPDGFPGNANLWVGGMEMHQTKASYVPVTGTAPFGIRADDGSFEVNLAGGKDGARVVSIDHLKVAPGYAHGHWQFFVQRYRHGFTDGAYELYHAEEGDTALAPVVSKSGISTLYAGTQNYPLWGLYRDQTGDGETVMYLAGVREYSTVAEALDYAKTLLGSPAPPPADTARILIGKAENELAHTTITYPDWKHRVDSGFYAAKKINPATGTGWGRAFVYLDAAKAVQS